MASNNNLPEFKGKAPSVNDLSQINKSGFVSEYESYYKPPNFTLKEIRDAIPPHLFQRNLATSSMYLIVNLIICAIVFYLATFIDTLPKPIATVAWIAYWYFQGVFGTGLWVLGHECGHQAFSNYKRINDAIGFCLHSFLLTPYFSWRISHSQHHALTGNLGEDIVYVPKPRSKIRPIEPSPWQEALESSPLYVTGVVALYLLGGWPGYLFFNVSSNVKKFPPITHHFSHTTPLFQPQHRNLVLASNIGLILMLLTLGLWTYETSVWTVTKFYGIPLIIVNAWNVCITYLHHTDVYLPHYSPKEWNFVRGALTTVDRDYGWFLNTALHHVHDHHVVHHLFSQMPHYNTVKATAYVKKVIGEYYLHDKTPVWKALYRSAKNCQFIEDSGDVLFYHVK